MPLGGDDGGGSDSGDSTAEENDDGLTAAEISLLADPTSIIADGISTSTITATVKTATGQGVPDIEVSFGTDNGSITARENTDAEGKATATLTSSTEQGVVANVTASVGTIIPGTTTVTFTAPPGVSVDQITLSALPATLSVNGDSTITATVSIAGGEKAPDQTQVDFSIIEGGGDFNGLTTITANTTDGNALVTLNGPAVAGTTTLLATAGGKTASVEVMFVDGSIELTVTPNSMLTTGSETPATVIATVKTTLGAPVSEGAEIKFTVDDPDLGTLSPTGLISYTVATTNGKASTTFNGGTNAGAVTITATWTDQGISDETQITMLPPPGIIQLKSGFPDPASISIQGTGGNSTSTVTFQVKDVNGALVSDGYRVNFKIVGGPGGGEMLTTDYVTTVGGQVTTVVKSGNKAGTLGIKAIYADNSNVSTTLPSIIAIVGGLPVGSSFGISAQYLNISGLNNALLEDVISINAADLNGNKVPDNTSISFKTYETGGSFFPGSETTTTNGTATNTLLSSGSSAIPANGFVSVTAETIGGKSTHITCIAIDPDNADIIYAGTDGGGVYRSINKGLNWVNISASSSPDKTGQNWIDPYVNDIAIDPDDTNCIYAAVGYLGRGNLYRSNNRGETWDNDNVEQWYGLIPGLNAAVLTAEADDATSDYVWIGTYGKGAWRSEDGENFLPGGDVTTTMSTSADEKLILMGGNKGQMSMPILGLSAKTEYWTVTYNPTIIAATATEPEAGDNTGTGIMSPIATNNDATPTDSWTVTCYDQNSGLWSVTGELFGYIGDAKTGELFNNPAYGIKFTILSGTTLFLNTDTFTFDTVASSLIKTWNVFGYSSGTHTQGITNCSYTSNNGEISFLIIEGAIDFADGDKFNFTTYESGLGNGIIVTDIVREPITHEDSAVLYAGTVSGVYKSIDGGKTWKETTNFAGDNITCLVHHPDPAKSGYLYAGTKSSGVYYTNNGGTTPWVSKNDGLAMASKPIFAGTGTAKGSMSSVEISAATETEEWTIECVQTAIGGGTFSVSGSLSNTQTSYHIVDGTYTSNGGEVSFTITPGIVDFEIGDKFVFNTLSGSIHVTDIVIPSTGTDIYVTTYYENPDVYHATGNVFKSAGADAGGISWTVAGTGLPQYEPPEDTSLCAQHALAADPATGSTLYVGGEGINMYYSADSGAQWSQRKNGLTNRIMARMPVLFTDDCSLNIYPDSQIVPVNFKIYIQDKNGNPPISGSTFEIWSISMGARLEKLYTKVYSDSLVNNGTYSDPSNTATDNPIFFSYSGCLPIEFCFTPTCEDEAPGCSGGEQSIFWP
jgi:Bacterial Ig-like domain (group 1)